MLKDFKALKVYQSKVFRVFKAHRVYKALRVFRSKAFRVLLELCKVLRVYRELKV